MTSTNLVPKSGNKSCVGECAYRSEVVDLDDHRLLGLTIAQVGDDAVVTRRGVLHDAGIAIDGDAVVPHADNVPMGYDIDMSALPADTVNMSALPADTVVSADWPRMLIAGGTT